MNIYALSGIRTSNPSNRAASDLRHRPHDHRDQLPYHRVWVMENIVKWTEVIFYNSFRYSFCFRLVYSRESKVLLLLQNCLIMTGTSNWYCTKSSQTGYRFANLSYATEILAQIQVRNTISCYWVNFFELLHRVSGATQWRRWSRHCATTRKVAGSILVVVSGIFHLYNPSGLTRSLMSITL